MPALPHEAEMRTHDDTVVVVPVDMTDSTCPNHCALTGHTTHLHICPRPTWSFVQAVAISFGTSFVAICFFTGNVLIALCCVATIMSIVVVLQGYMVRGRDQ